LLRRTARPPSRRVRGACEVEEVCSLGLVELQRTGKRLENALRNATRVATLEPGVVVDADSGEQGALLPPKPWNASSTAEGAQTRLLRRDLRASGGQELADLVPRVHNPRVARLGARCGGLAVPGSTGSVSRRRPVLQWCQKGDATCAQLSCTAPATSGSRTSPTPV